jgi:hypothetical protein
MDSQQVEITGRNWLVNRLIEDGLEVARPERDRGVDLIAYLDVAEAGRFVARPIQMKVATRARFGIDTKLAKIADLLVVFVWLREDTAYALSYLQMMEVADKMGYTATAGTRVSGRYDTTSPSRRLRGYLEPYRMGPGDWRERIVTGR